VRRSAPKLLDQILSSSPLHSKGDSGDVGSANNSTAAASPAAAALLASKRAPLPEYSAFELESDEDMEVDIVSSAGRDPAAAPTAAPAAARAGSLASSSTSSSSSEHEDGETAGKETVAPAVTEATLERTGAKPIE